jgi:hypothetical protein
MLSIVAQSRRKVKRLIVAAMFLASTLPIGADPQNGRVLTVTAGTPVPLIPNASQVNPVIASSIFIQALHNGAGIIYILNCNPQTTCSKGNATTILVAELSPASPTSPGGWFRFPSNGQNGSGGTTDVRYWQIDGTNSGDTVATSWDLRQ